MKQILRFHACQSLNLTCKSQAPGCRSLSPKVSGTHALPHGEEFRRSIGVLLPSFASNYLETPAPWKFTPLEGVVGVFSPFGSLLGEFTSRIEQLFIKTTENGHWGGLKSSRIPFITICTVISQNPPKMHSGGQESSRILFITENTKLALTWIGEMQTYEKQSEYWFSVLRASIWIICKRCEIIIPTTLGSVRNLSILTVSVFREIILFNPSGWKALIPMEIRRTRWEDYRFWSFRRMTHPYSLMRHGQVSKGRWCQIPAKSHFFTSSDLAPAPISLKMHEN